MRQKVYLGQRVAPLMDIIKCYPSMERRAIVVSIDMRKPQNTYINANLAKNRGMGKKEGNRWRIGGTLK